ncbi:SGNH/GDSL hydrolase family protein [Bradyrhizobium sp. 2]|uniref:SGNH/GDSL hydrolase family protein n=1 Tax=Bradyrhizobium sp. 2 TaxID=190045 RepID=UPI001FF903EF|nr:SGNH/GDSL hydrolase family protein [Bradyrhizobium sp. 2]MCK1465780.1 SGNH/GDSL hydrolase family protein [Bradyrhizobium sp. 2]
MKSIRSPVSASLNWNWVFQSALLAAAELRVIIDQVRLEVVDSAEWYGSGMNRAIAITCLIIAVGGFGWTYERVNKISSRLNLLTEMVSVQNERVQIRLFMIRSQLAQAKNPIVFVGDSITEAALLPSSLCGMPIVNAGIGRETAASYAYTAKRLFTRIPLAVVAIGTNDALASNQSFRESYEQLLDDLPAKKLVLVGLPPLESNSGEVESYNQIIEQIAKERGFCSLLRRSQRVRYQPMEFIFRLVDTPNGSRQSLKPY